MALLLHMKASTLRPPFFVFQAEDGIRDLVRSRGLGDVYKRQVHQRFRPEHIAAFRAEHPDGLVVVHPECAHDVVELADTVGSTEVILRTVTEEAPPGSVIGVGTEVHMVQRMADENPDRTIVSLDPLVCPCCLLYTSPSPRDRTRSRMPSSA